MADATSRKLLELLDAERPVELRFAAARVLGEVGTRSKELDRALCAALDDSDQQVRLQALEAIGRLKVEPALPRLLERVAAGGPEAEPAARAAARLGAKGLRGLKDAMKAVAPGLRRQIAGALAAGDTASADSAALDTLFDSDPGVVDAATRTLVSRIPGLSKEQKRALGSRVVDALNGHEGELSVPTETSLLRILVALGDPRVEDAYWSRLKPATPSPLRLAALQGLGALGTPKSPERIRRLLACAVDQDFRVAATALMALRGVPVDARNAKDWLVLFAAPDPGTRSFAVDKLGALDTPPVAGALLAQVNHADRQLHDAALGRLKNLRNGRRLLGEALLAAGNVDEAWALARAQADLAATSDKALRRSIFERAAELIEEGDRRADPMLFFLRHADPKELRDWLEEQALALRKRKRYEAALRYLSILLRDPAVAEAVRFEAAACGLKLSSHDLAAEARTKDPALHQFARLLHQPTPAVAQMLEKARWLDVEDLYYLGFHLAEGQRLERDLGALALRLVIKRSPRSKRATDARRKLANQGLKN